MDDRGEMLKELIKQTGSRVQFAERCGIPRTNLYRWLADIEAMPVGALETIARNLGIRVDEIIESGWETDKHIVLCTNEEYEIIEKYRNDALTREMIKKIVL